MVNDPRPDQLIPTIVTMSRHNAASNVHYPRGIGKHNVSNLIYVPLIAPNTSVYPTAIVISNHAPINQSYSVSTEAMCNSRKTNLCSSPCTISSNVNNMSKSTSDKPPSKALKTIKQPRKVKKIAHVNIRSLRNKVFEVNNLHVTDDIHILTISKNRNAKWRRCCGNMAIGSYSSPKDHSCGKLL
jgi:hypothetical protein